MMAMVEEAEADMWYYWYGPYWFGWLVAVFSGFPLTCFPSASCI